MSEKPGTLTLVEALYRWRLKEREKHVREEGVLYVTDILRCPLKLRYEQAYPELSAKEVFIPAGILGELVHIGLESLLHLILPESHVETEVEVERQLSIDNQSIRLKGRIDALVTRNGFKEVVEIKTGRSDFSIPHERHILQARIYAWMVEAGKACVLYITPDRIAEYVEEPLTEDVVANMVKQALSGVQAPLYEWECGYCPYSVLCSNKISAR